MDVFLHDLSGPRIVTSRYWHDRVVAIFRDSDWRFQKRLKSVQVNGTDSNASLVRPSAARMICRHGISS